MSNFRLNRIFADKSGRFLGVAMEESFFAERDILSALESARAILSDGADVLQVDAAQALLIQSAPGIPKQPLIVAMGELKSSASRKKISLQDQLEVALRLDAACALIRLNPVSRVSSAVLPESRSILRFKEACDRVGMPMMIEIPAFPDGSLKMAERNLMLVEHAAELGADVIRTNIPLGVERYRSLLEAADGIPLVASANEIASAGSLVRWAEAVLGEGVSGILLGSALIASPRSTSLMRSLRDTMHSQRGLPGDGRKPLRARNAGRCAGAGAGRETLSNLSQD